MKRNIPVSDKSRGATGWHKHLDTFYQRLANKSTRRILQREADDLLDEELAHKDEDEE